MGKCTFGAGLFKKRGFYFAFCRKETKAMTNRKNAFHAIWLLIDTHLFTFLQKENLNCFFTATNFFISFQLNWTSALKSMDFISILSLTINI